MSAGMFRQPFGPSEPKRGNPYPCRCTRHLQREMHQGESAASSQYKRGKLSNPALVHAPDRSASTLSFSTLDSSTKTLGRVFSVAITTPFVAAADQRRPSKPKRSLVHRGVPTRAKTSFAEIPSRHCNYSTKKATESSTVGSGYRPLEAISDRDSKTEGGLWGRLRSSMHGTHRESPNRLHPSGWHAEHVRSARASLSG